MNVVIYSRVSSQSARQSTERQVVDLERFAAGRIAYNHFKGTQDPDWETMEKEYMAEKEEKERQAS